MRSFLNLNPGLGISSPLLHIGLTPLKSESESESGLTHLKSESESKSKSKSKSKSNQNHDISKLKINHLSKTKKLKRKTESISN